MISHFFMNDPNPELYSMTDGIVRPDRNIPLEAALKLAENDPIWANRGKAIQAYAILEGAICKLISDLSGMNQEAAETIFYKITSTGAKNSILETLIQNKYGNTFNLFWNSVFKQHLRGIDTKRNEIVHWLTVLHATINAENVMIVGVSIVKPNVSSHDNNSPRISSDDLIEYAAKCGIFARLFNMFLFVSSKDDDPSLDTWQEIYRQPLIYPLPEDHPLYASSPIPNNPPQSWRG